MKQAGLWSNISARSSLRFIRVGDSLPVYEELHAKRTAQLKTSKPKQLECRLGLSKSLFLYFPFLSVLALPSSPRFSWQLWMARPADCKPPHCHQEPEAGDESTHFVPSETAEPVVVFWMLYVSSIWFCLQMLHTVLVFLLSRYSTPKRDTRGLTGTFTTMPVPVQVAYKPIAKPQVGENNYQGFHPGKAETLPKGWNRYGARALASDIRLEHDVEIKVRDGCRLYVDICRPANATEKVPAILRWSCYDKKYSALAMLPMTVWNCCVGLKQDLSGLEKFEGRDPQKWCPRGYAIVSVDSRGTGNSDGQIPVMGSQDGEGGPSRKWSGATAVLVWLATPP